MIKKILIPHEVVVEFIVGRESGEPAAAEAEGKENLLRGVDPRLRAGQDAHIRDDEKFDAVAGAWEKVTSDAENYQKDVWKCCGKVYHLKNSIPIDRAFINQALSRCCL